LNITDQFNSSELLLLSLPKTSSGTKEAPTAGSCHHFAHAEIVKLLWHWLVLLTKSRRRLEAEILLLRHQLNILRRKAPRRTRLTNADRLAFVWLIGLARPQPEPSRSSGRRR
jgi:hypothetical protein